MMEIEEGFMKIQSGCCLHFTHCSPSLKGPKQGIEEAERLLLIHRTIGVCSKLQRFQLLALLPLEMDGLYCLHGPSLHSNN